MDQINEVQDLLDVWGGYLRLARLERGDSMAVFAERIGVSDRTVRAMERGSPAVQVGTWLQALWILDRLDEARKILQPRESLIDRARSMDKPRRQRAPRRRT